jgi:hypothetical protein
LVAGDKSTIEVNLIILFQAGFGEDLDPFVSLFEVRMNHNFNFGLILDQVVYCDSIKMNKPRVASPEFS